MVTLTEDATGRVISYDRDGSDALLDVNDSANPAGSGILYSYSSSPDAYSLVAVSNQRGNDIVEIGYDSNDRVTSYTAEGQSVEYDYSVTGTVYKDFPDGSQERVTMTTLGRYETILDSYGNLETFEYDSEGFLTSVVTEDGDGNETSETYERGCACSPSQLVSLVEPNGVTWTYEYDTAGNLVTEIDPLGQETIHEYDGNGNRTATEDPLGNRTTHSYNSVGQVLTTTDPRGYVTVYTYDSSGNLTSMVGPKGVTSTYTHDTVSNRISYTGPNGNLWGYGYDSASRLEVVTNPLGQEAFHEYDADGNRTLFSNTAGAITTYVYDDLNRLLEVHRPSTSVRYLQYTTNGDLVSDTAQPMFSHVYDGHHRRLYSLRDGGNSGAVVYSYDSQGNTTGVKDILDAVSGDPTGEDGDLTSYEYDGRKRRTKKTDPEGGVWQYFYDGAGRLVESIEPDGGITTQVYDVAGRNIETINPLGGSTLFSHDPSGNRTSAIDPLDNVTTYVYDGQGRMTTTTDPIGNTCSTTTVQIVLLGYKVEKRSPVIS